MGTSLRLIIRADVQQHGVCKEDKDRGCPEKFTDAKRSEMARWTTRGCVSECSSELKNKMVSV